MFQKLGRQDYHGRSSIADLLVLQLGQLYKHFRRRVLNVELLQNCGAVVSDSDLACLVYQHLIQAQRSQGRLHDISHGTSSRDILRAHVLTCGALAPDLETCLRRHA